MVKECAIKRVLCGDYDCNNCFKKSIASILDRSMLKWSPENELNPRDVFRGSGVKYLFECSKCKHKFMKAPGQVKINGSCPYCYGITICNDDCDECFKKSFATHKMAKQWSSKNTLKPRDVMRSIEKTFWFDCDLCDHIYLKKLRDIDDADERACQYCAGKKLCGNEKCKSCFTKSFASHSYVEYWDYSKNKKTPLEVFKNSRQKCWFNCTICKHSFDKVAKFMIEGGCSYCNGNEICIDSKCTTCFYKSFASHEKSRYWDISNDLLHMQVSKGSAKKYLFKCGDCKHFFKMSPTAITSGGRWCGYCSIMSPMMCDDEKCEFCFNKSFDSHPKAKCWSKKNKITPREVSKHSRTKYWFYCDKCKHEFMNTPQNIAIANRWCRYCARFSSLLCDNNKCNFCKNRSFRSHPRVKFFSKKNNINPRDIHKGTQKKYYFECEEGHEFMTSPHSILEGYWCPKCMYKTEKKLLKWLETNFNNYTIIHQAKLDWCKNEETGKYLPFDFYIKELKLCVDLDGRQHFKQVQNWNPPEMARTRDVYKMKLAQNNNCSIIRILQEDVFFNKNNWEIRLKKSIKKYNTPTIIYLDNKNEYEQHKKDMQTIIKKTKVV
jgi:hypothetical protein